MLRELNRRSSNGGQIQVCLTWDDQTDQVYVEAEDAQTGCRTVLTVDPPSKATYVFNHPFSYAEEAVGGFRRPA